MGRQLKRKLGVIPYSVNNVSRLELPRNHVFKQIMLTLTGTLNVTGAGGTLHDEEPQALLTAVRIIRNGSEVLQSLDGGTLFRLGALNWGAEPPRTPIGAVAVAAYPFSVSIPIDFTVQGMFNPSITLLKAVGTSSLILEVVWGNESTIFGGGTKAFSVTPSILVEGMEIMDLGGNFGDKILRVIERQVTGVSSEFQIDMPVGELYRRIVLKATDEATAGLADSNLNDAVIQSVKCVIDGILYLLDTFTYNGLRSMNKLQFDQETLASGYAVIDFAEDGNPLGLINTIGASDFKLILAVTNAGTTGTVKVRAIPETIVPGSEVAAA